MSEPIAFDSAEHVAPESERRMRLASVPEPPSVEILPGMLGESASLKRAADLTRRIAPSDASVLITGESGTGKDLFAHAIHSESGRRGRFVAVNCAAMTEQLLESELFGHVRGAFTDAKTSRDGLFVEADGGTLFLDEIGEMSPNMQSKLLRALEEGRVRPVGSSTEVPVDARIVAATNMDVERELDSGRFRQDLFYRINVVRIAVPPLRERGCDVLILAREFLADAARRNGRSVIGMSEEVESTLCRYPFPGNVRELLNVLERAVALTRHQELTLDDLPPAVRHHDGYPEPTNEASNPDQLLPLRELERRHIRRVLRATHGNKARAAKILGLDRRTLYRKLARESEASTYERLTHDP